MTHIINARRRARIGSSVRPPSALVLVLVAVVVATLALPTCEATAVAPALTRPSRNDKVRRRRRDRELETPEPTWEPTKSPYPTPVTWEPTQSPYPTDLLDETPEPTIEDNDTPEPTWKPTKSAYPTPVTWDPTQSPYPTDSLDGGETPDPTASSYPTDRPEPTITPFPTSPYVDAGAGVNRAEEPTPADVDTMEPTMDYSDGGYTSTSLPTPKAWAPTPPTSHPTFEYDPSTDDPIQLDDDVPTYESPEEMMQDRNLEIAAGVLSGLMLVLWLFTAYQIMENPDGLCAGICRLTLKCICCIARVLCLPCRFICCGGTQERDRRSHVAMGSEDHHFSNDLELS